MTIRRQSTAKSHVVPGQSPTHPHHRGVRVKAAACPLPDDALVDARVMSESTALMILAIRNAATDAIPVLIRRGADPLTASPSGQTILDIAENLGQTVFLDALDRVLVQPEAALVRQRTLRSLPPDRARRILPRAASMQAAHEAAATWNRGP